MINLSDFPTNLIFSKSCVNWGLNTKNFFIEVDNLLISCPRGWGKIQNKAPKWAWLLCAKSSALGLSIYSNVSVRLTCCNIRKLGGMKDLLKIHSWITGLRIAQSSFRANNKIIQWDWRHNNIKFCPILFWSIEDPIVMICFLFANDVKYIWNLTVDISPIYVFYLIIYWGVVRYNTVLVLRHTPLR